jgi:hypothetical protein
MVAQVGRVALGHSGPIERTDACDLSDRTRLGARATPT